MPFFFSPLLCLSWPGEDKRKPNQKDTDAGKWFLGKVVKVPLLEAFEKELE